MTVSPLTLARVRASFTLFETVPELPASKKNTHHRSISVELASVRLPFSGGSRDDWRALAWINSICALFLVIGVLGFRPRPNHQSLTRDQANVVPIVFMPEVKQEELKPVFTEFSPSSQSETVAEPAPPPVVAVAEPAQVSFPVAIEGPVTLVAPRYSPPTSAPSPSRPDASARQITFNADNNPHGYFPKPTYPPSELAAHHEGRVMLAVVIAPNGKAQSVTVNESSGWEKLDEAAVQKVRDDWDFGPGNTRYFRIPLVFQIQ
jgi:TonB family protein